MIVAVMASFLFLPFQVLSQLLRKAKQKNLVIPNVKQAGSEQGTFEGATVSSLFSFSLDVLVVQLLPFDAPFLNFTTCRYWRQRLDFTKSQLLL